MKCEISMIGGADGPTAVFVAGKKRQKSPWSIRTYFRKRKRVRIERQITDENHTIRQVCGYITKKLGFTRISRRSEEYQQEYRDIRIALLTQYAPELLGEDALMPPFREREEDIRKLIEWNERRLKTAESIPRELFDIDLWVFEKQEQDTKMCFLVETVYGYIGGSASGSHRICKKFDRLYREVYRYYGVTKKDIEKKSRRYQELVSVLERKG